MYSDSGNPQTDNVLVAHLKPSSARPTRVRTSSCTAAPEPSPPSKPSRKPLGRWALFSDACRRPPASASQACHLFDPTGPELSENSALGPSDLSGPSDFKNPQEQPLIYTVGDTRVRPSVARQRRRERSDQFTETSGSPLQLDVFEGATIPVTPNASPRRFDAGGTVTFTASVHTRHTLVSYDWDFDGGATDSTTASPHPVFHYPGVYKVGVQVIDSAGEHGNGWVTITVNNANGTPPPIKHSGTTPPQLGPANSKGNTPRAKPGNASNGQSSNFGGDHAPKSRGRIIKRPTRRRLTARRRPLRARRRHLPEFRSGPGGSGSGSSGGTGTQTTGTGTASPHSADGLSRRPRALNRPSSRRHCCRRSSDRRPHAHSRELESARQDRVGTDRDGAGGAPARWPLARAGPRSRARRRSCSSHSARATSCAGGAAGGPALRQLTLRCISLTCFRSSP